MKTENERKTVISCSAQCRTLQLHKLFHRPCFNLICSETSHLSSNFKEITNYNSVQKNAFKPFHGNWSLFPSVQAVSPPELKPKVFSLDRSDETGMDRLKMMFSTTEFGHVSPELHIVINTIGISLFMGSTIGGILASRTAVEKLVRQYQSAAFNHQFEAKRFFQDRITLTLASSAFKWAWRLALFSGTYTTIIVGAAVYNNKSTIWEHIAAGAICGSLWKLKLGLQATAVGGGLGGVLGLIAGCLCGCVLWISGTSVEEMRYWHHDYWEREYRKQIKILREKQSKPEPGDLELEHEKRLEERKKSLLKDGSS